MKLSEVIEVHKRTADIADPGGAQHTASVITVALLDTLGSELPDVYAMLDVVCQKLGQALAAGYVNVPADGNGNGAS